MIKTRFKDHNCGQLNLTNIDEQITLSGWVSTIRDLGGILFVELRDRSGFFQIVANPQINPQVHKVLERVRSEYVIKVTGKFQKDLKKLIMKNTQQDKLKCILNQLKFYLNQKFYHLY